MLQSRNQRLYFNRSQPGRRHHIFIKRLPATPAKENKIPNDIRFKTYCSAGPKPGNLYFAYDYENITAGGWAYNVVNSADWVPDVPFTVQTVDDFTAVNPFTNAKTMIKKQKFPKNLVLKHIYNQLSKPSKKPSAGISVILVKWFQNQLPSRSRASRYPCTTTATIT